MPNEVSINLAAALTFFQFYILKCVYGENSRYHSPSPVPSPFPKHWPCPQFEENKYFLDMNIFSQGYQTKWPGPVCCLAQKLKAVLSGPKTDWKGGQGGSRLRVCSIIKRDLEKLSRRQMFLVRKKCFKSILGLERMVPLRFLWREIICVCYFKDLFL